MSKIKLFLKFVNHDIWRLRPSEIPKNKFFLIRQLRTIVLTIRGFFDDDCMLRASALTFFTLMSIVPVAALIFGIAKGFGYEQVLEHQLVDKFEGHEAILSKVMEFARNLLANTAHEQGGWIAGFGITLLLWTVIKLLGNIESAFNGIWGIKKSRTFGRKMGDYLVFTGIAPLFLIIAGSITVVIQSFLAQFTETSYSEYIGPFIFLILKLIPYLIIWFVFTFLYMFMPNTKVSFKAGIAAGITAGTIFQLVQGLYIAAQFGVAKYGAIYGSFAALPLFLIWLEMSWMIVLFGAELAYANQNVGTYDFEPDSKKASLALQRLVALYIVAGVCKRFDAGESPLTVEDISKNMEIPPSLTRRVLNDLEDCGILTRVEAYINDEELSAFHPTLNLEKLTVQYIYDKLDSFGANDIPIKESDELKNIKENLKKLHCSIEKSKGNIILRDV